MKIPSAAILALALPLALSAQQPAGDPANPLTTVFKGRINGLEANIAQHIASDNYLFCNNFGAAKANLAAEDTATADSVKAKWPKAKLVSKLKDSFAFCQTALGQLNDAALSETITLTFGTRTQQRPRVAMVLGHALDLADHYSQLANYMRLNNILPPTALPRSGRGGN